MDYFKNFVQKKEVTEERSRPSGGVYGVKVDYIAGWFLQFFAYYNEKNQYIKKIRRFEQESLKVEEFYKLANQMLIVPFTIGDVNKNEYKMKYKVGFVGCEQNEKKEVIPAQGWIVCPSDKMEEDELNEPEKRVVY